MIRKVVFYWDDKHGNCDDCGNPVAYVVKNQNFKGEEITFQYCSRCAALHASEGEKIIFLNAEQEVS